MNNLEYPFYYTSDRWDDDCDGGPASTADEAARDFEGRCNSVYRDESDWHTAALAIEEGVDVYGDAISTELVILYSQCIDERMLDRNGCGRSDLVLSVLDEGDHDIIEELHDECAPCSDVYYAARYAMAHYAKHGEAFEPLVKMFSYA